MREEIVLAHGREALEIVEAFVRRKVGNHYGDAALGALFDAAGEWRDSEIPEGHLIPLMDASYPMPWDKEGICGQAAFYITCGGSEFDCVLVDYKFDTERNMTLTFAYGGTDERFDYPDDEDEEAAEG